MHYLWRGVFWICVYLFLVLSPLIALLIGRPPAGNGFTWDFSMALGFCGTAMMGALFLQTARFQRLSAPFGIDIIYYFHRLSAVIAFGFILAHPLLLFTDDAGTLSVLALSIGNWPYWAGMASLVAFGFLTVSSLWRKPLHLHYDSWRILHASMACCALGLAIIHILAVSHYVDVPWKKALWTGLISAWLSLLVYIRLVKPMRLLRTPYRVTDVRAEHGETWTVQLEPDGHPGFSFEPGQFAWITAWSSPFCLKEHPFSIASSAENPTQLRFSIKSLGDFSARIKELEIGETVFVDGPYGCFSIDREPAESYVFIAGGVGIAPIMGMLRTLADRNDERPLHLVYAYNTLERLTFREELQDLQQKLDLRVTIVLKDPPQNWQGESGLIDAAILDRHLPGDKRMCEYFICGPTQMLHLVERLLAKQGVPLGKIHSELFDLV